MNGLARCGLLTALLAGALAAAPTVAALFPANGATEVCPDTPLRLTFDAPPTVAAAGRIRVFTAADALVDTIDLSVSPQTRVIGGITYNYLPVRVSGNEVSIALHTGVLTYGQTYFVRIEPGVFTDSSGAHGGITEPAAWRFTTRRSAPAAGSASVIVAADGTGDFCTVQGAVDFVPVNNRQRVVIDIRRGLYEEMVLVRNRPFLALRGEERRQTVITYPDNANLNSGNNRCMVGIDSADCVLEHLTLRNSTPKGGSQAEVLRVNAPRVLVHDCDFSSFQDTLFVGGTVYFTNCLVEGDVDFIWGGGAAYFHRCEIRALNRGYNVQSRSGAGQFGYVFNECTVTAAPGVTGHVLARTDTTSYPACQVVYLNCTIGSHISPEGWLITGTGGTAGLQFWEYANTDPAGRPLDVSRRAVGSRQLTAAEAAPFLDPANVLGGWQPRALLASTQLSGQTPSAASRLVNLSVRSFAGTGEQVLTAGFVVRGEGGKEVLVRGVGPGLVPLGVDGVLADPRLDFHVAGSVRHRNDNWGGAATLADRMAGLGAFALDPAGLDAVLLVPALADGPYTAQVLGADGTSGNALIEVYDAAPDADSRLVNLSARTQFAPGVPFIAGFVVGGTGHRNLLLRAVGPGLTQLGLSGVLANPKLEVYSGTIRIYENDDWTPEVAPVFDEVSAFGLIAGSRDAVLHVTLPAGNYTVNVGSVDGTSGLVLVEVYDVR